MLVGSPVAVAPTVLPVTVCPHTRAMASAHKSLVTVKLLVEVPVPPGPVTAMGPVVAPAGTVTVIWVAEFATKPLAATPLNVTCVASSKKLPVSTTTVPAGPAAGANDVTTGASITVKLVADVPVATGVVTLMGPVVAPAGTVAVIWVAEFTAKPGAKVPLNRTCEAAEKPVPVMTTAAPTAPAVGAKLVMTGGAPTTNGAAEVPVPVGATAVMVPVVVPAATVAVIWVAEFTAKPVAAVPLNATAAVPVKLVPVRTTTVPASPPVGVKLLMVGPATGGVMVKLTFEMSKK